MSALPLDQHNFGPHKVVILAGGFGTRLAEHTDEMPKPMVQIGGRPILWHILKIYSHFGFDDFLIACGYRGDVIKRFFLDYHQQQNDLVIDFAQSRIERLSETAEPWRVALIDTGNDVGTGGRLRRLKPYLNGQTIFMTYGDGVANVDLARLLAFHKSHGKSVTFTAVRAPAAFGRPRFEGDRVVGFDEKPQDDARWVNGGFFAIEPGVLDAIPHDETSFEMCTLPALARAGELMAYRHDGFWHPMDTLRDVRNLNRMCSEPNAPWKVWEPQ